MGTGRSHFPGRLWSYIQQKHLDLKKEAMGMADGILLENGIEWWLSDDKTTWYTRKLGADEWNVETSGKGPNSSSVATKITELEDRFNIIESVTTADGTKVDGHQNQIWTEEAKLKKTAKS